MTQVGGVGAGGGGRAAGGRVGGQGGNWEASMTDSRAVAAEAQVAGGVHGGRVGWGGAGRAARGGDGEAGMGGGVNREDGGLLGRGLGRPGGGARMKRRAGRVMGRLALGGEVGRLGGEVRRPGAGRPGVFSGEAGFQGGRSIGRLRGRGEGLAWGRSGEGGANGQVGGKSGGVNGEAVGWGLLRHMCQAGATGQGGLPLRWLQVRKAGDNDGDVTKIGELWTQGRAGAGWTATFLK